MSLTLAQQAAESPDVGKRVITQYGTVLQVGGQVVDDEGRGKQLARGKDHKDFRIYKVEAGQWPVASGRWPRVPASRVGHQPPMSSCSSRPSTKQLTNQIRANRGAAANYLWRANVWRARKELDIAISDYNEAINSIRETRLPTTTGASPGVPKKDYDKAISDYNEAIRLDQGNAGPPQAGRSRVDQGSVRGWWRTLGAHMS